MRAQPITVRLGDAEWRVRPLTLLQIQEIEPLLRASDQSTGRSIAMAIKIIAVALTRDHPAAAETLSEIEADTQEIGPRWPMCCGLAGLSRARLRNKGI